MSDSQSDAFCCVATGASHAARTLYTNTEEVLLTCRPVITNGISDYIQRPDLLSRTIALNLSSLDPTRRRSEQSFYADFAAKHPLILGAILDGVSMALRDRAKVEAEVSSLPRLADFAVTAMAAMPAFGKQPQEFWRHWRATRLDTA